MATATASSDAVKITTTSPIKEFASSEIARALSGAAPAGQDAPIINIFTLHYRAKYRPESSHLRAANIQEAKQLGFAYCQRWNLKYISVTPFFLDLDAVPGDTMP